MHHDLYLISIDCLRPDYLGAYNLLRHQTPNLDRLADRAALFTQAVSHAPFTTPALASLLTGRYPYQTGVRLLLGQLCQGNLPTLTEFARRAGYLTLGLPSTFILNSDTGLDRGFDHYRDIHDGHDTGRGGCWQNGELLNQALDDLLTHAGRQPVFAWIHYFDLHDYHLDKTAPIETSYPRDLRDRIDRDCIGGLLDVLDRHRRLDDAAFIITADHGEDLFQHGTRGHGHHLYDSVLRVPLLWSFPGHAGPPRIDHQVRHVDLMPTLLELWGYPRENWPAGLDGHSLVPLLRGQYCSADALPRPANSSYAEASPRQLFEGDVKTYKAFAGPEQRSLRTANHKLILHDDGRREFYDLNTDPNEMTNLADARRDLADRFAATLTELASRDADRFGHLDIRPEDEDKVMNRLRELGYVA